MCRFDTFVLSISVLGHLLIIGFKLIISDLQHFKFIDKTRVRGTECGIVVQQGGKCHTQTTADGTEGGWPQRICTSKSLGCGGCLT